MTADELTAAQLRSKETVTITVEDGLYIATDTTTGISSQGQTETEALSNLATSLESYEDGQSGDDSWL